MNSLTWLLNSGRTRSQESLTQSSDHPSDHPKNHLTQTNHLSDPSSKSKSTLSTSVHPTSSSSALHLGSGPRETEAELVDNMVHSIERQSGSIAANKLERKTSMGLDGKLRFGLFGITERRRKVHLDPSPTRPSRSNSVDSLDLSNQSTLSTPLSSSPSSPPSRSPMKLLSSYRPYRDLVQLLPIRLGVKLYILIRKFLSLFGLRHLSSSDSPPQSTFKSSSSSPPPPSEKTASDQARIRFLRSMWSRFSPKNKSDKPKELVRRNKTLVLDLDETLIHSTSRLGGIGGTKAWSNQSNNSAGLKVRVVEVVLDGRIVVYHVYKRPWVDFFLKTVSSWYTVVIFTASMREYADPVIDWLDQGRGLIEGRLFRESCTNIQGSYVKDLTVVERDLSKVCLVDNSPISYGLHQANGIPIEGWLNDPKDEGLLELLPMLDSLRFTKDVRRILGLKAFSLETPQKI